MAGFGESKHEPALRETHVSKSLEFADSTARSGGYAAPLEDLSSREKPWGPRPQLSTKVERHHQGASQLPRQPKARRLLSASTPPSEPQTWDSDSRKAAIPCRLQASADTQNLQSQTPLREAARSPGKDQSQRHRPLQPTAAYSRPSAARAPSRRPRPARTASIRTSGPDTAREAPRPPGSSEDGDRGDPPAHGFPALTMVTPWTRKQQKILRRSRPPSGDAASRAPPSLAPPSPGSGFSIGLLQVSRGFGGARQTVVCSERGGARPALRRHGLRTAGSEAVLGESRQKEQPKSAGLVHFAGTNAPSCALAQKKDALIFLSRPIRTHRGRVLALCQSAFPRAFLPAMESELVRRLAPRLGLAEPGVLR